MLDMDVSELLICYKNDYIFFPIVILVSEFINYSCKNLVDSVRFKLMFIFCTKFDLMTNKPHVSW